MFKPFQVWLDQAVLTPGRALKKPFDYVIIFADNVAVSSRCCFFLWGHEHT